MGDDKFLEETLTWWLENDALSEKLERFCDGHCDKFPDENKDGSIPEQTNELMDLFNQYKTMLEEEIEKYLSGKGVSTDEFYKMCASTTEEDHEASILGWILAATEYDSFYRSMMDEKRSKQ